MRLIDSKQLAEKLNKSLPTIVLNRRYIVGAVRLASQNGKWMFDADLIDACLRAGMPVYPKEKVGRKKKNNIVPNLAQCEPGRCSD